MFINFKDKMYIYHPDGKFTEKQLIELLEAARKMGYDEGYEAAKAYYNKPNWWYYTNTAPVVNLPYVTCDSTNSNLTSITTTATNIEKLNDLEKSYTFECKVDPKESQEAINKIIGNNNVKIREFKFNGTER